MDPFLGRPKKPVWIGLVSFGRALSSVLLLVNVTEGKQNLNMLVFLLECRKASWMWPWLSSIKTHDTRSNNGLARLMLIDRF